MGRLLELRGNAQSREMAATFYAKVQNPAYRVSLVLFLHFTYDFYPVQILLAVTSVIF